MIPELGNVALILAFCLALAQASFPLMGVVGKRPLLQTMAKPCATGQVVLLTIAVACLVASFVTNNFSVAYVAQHSNRLLPMVYKVAALWGGHEGSLLLWVYLLGLWTLCVCLFSKKLPQETTTLVLAVLGMVSVGFLLFLIATSNPFARLLPQYPADGSDLNPLLQDPGLAIHPPTLYLGYVG